MIDVSKAIAALHPFTEWATLEWPMTPELQMEAAMCLWEEVIGAADGDAVTQCRNMVGTAQFRHDLMALVEPLHIGWHVHERACGMTEDTEHLVLCPFDWAFTPWFLRKCVEFDAAGFITLKPDWLDLCRKARADDDA